MILLVQPMAVREGNVFIRKHANEHIAPDSGKFRSEKFFVLSVFSV